MGRVRIHTDARAAASAEAIGAAAFTLRDHVVFASGKYRPETPSGWALLKHELVHAAQQRGAEKATAEVTDPDHPLEQNARAVLAGNAAPEPAAHAVVLRQGKDEQLPPHPLRMRPQAPVAIPPVTLFPPAADLPMFRRFLSPRTLVPRLTLPPLRAGAEPSPHQVSDAARSVWLTSFERPDFRRFVIDSFLRAQAGSADLTLHDQPIGPPRPDLEPQAEPSTPAAAEDKGPDVTHQTLIGFDPQNTAVLPRSQHVRGSGVGVVVDQAAAQWDASAYQHRWRNSSNPAGDVTLSLLTSPTIQAQTEGFPQPAADNNNNVASNVQQASIAAGGSLAQIQRGPDDNPSITVTVGQVTGGPQAGSVSPRFGGPAVPSPTQFVFGFTPLQVEVGVHQFCDGSRLGIGFSAGGQVAVAPGQSPVMNFSPSGLTFTYHEGSADAARRGCR